MKVYKKLLLVALCVFLLLPLAIAQEKVTLEYKFKEGQTQYMLVVIQGQEALQLPESVQQGAMPTAFPMSMALIVSMKTLKAYSDGAADIEIRFLDGTWSMMGQEIPFPQIPQAIRIRMGKKGNILKLLTPLNTSTSQFNILASLDPNMLIQSFSSFAILPEQEVGVGDKWEVKINTELPSLGKINILQKMSLVSFEKIGDKNCAKISLEVPPSTFLLNIPVPVPGNAPQGQEATTMPVNGQMEMKGEMLFDYQNGNMVSQTGTLKMKLALEMPAAGAQGMPYQLTRNINMKFKVSFSEEKPKLPTPAQIQQLFQAPQEGQA